MGTRVLQREEVLDNFRRWGYLQASIDPFGLIKPFAMPELDDEGEEAIAARKIYCGTIGVEFMHIPDGERRRWIQDQMEREPDAPDRQRILEQLVRAEVFEEVIHTRYPGTKRFSIEGIAALIPLLEEILDCAIDAGAKEAIIGMSHRGRLTVIVQVVGKSPDDIFTEFEDVDPRSVLGGGDVKFHVGATGTHRSPDGRSISVRLVSNPSHLEAVDPVALGRVRAKQTRIGAEGTRVVIPILIHGDAAFAGQGIAAETLNTSALPGFTVGGTIHILANNLIGFTALPAELHSSRFASDLAKRLPIPVFHVNAEDPDAAVRVARIASEYRDLFSSSVVIDLIGFRKHGHSEIDDPTITQPILYNIIKDHPPLWKLYADRIHVDADHLAADLRAQYGQAKERAVAAVTIPHLSTLPEYWSKYAGGRFDRKYEIETGVPGDELSSISTDLATIPQDFAVHPKVKRLLDQRKRMGQGELPIDFGMAELLAFGSVLRQGVPVRMSGQDSERGTFSQRHAVLIDTINEKRYIPLQHISRNQAWFEIYNSELSEAAVMGFEFGFSRDYPDALVVWEAQFGDFANGGQVIIDQFIASSEDKWNLLSGLVLLLPHGYEGQGPEHSSARVERYLQLAAEDNMVICQPSSSAQYFHLLRRQALWQWRKPLVVFTPKSMLRSPGASSLLQAFTTGRFLKVLPDTVVDRAERVLICSGKIGRELIEERRRRNDRATAIVSIEQFYPFPDEELASFLSDYDDAHELVWVQEEPANMGALSFLLPKLEQLAGGRPVRSVKRSASAATATGSAKAYELEQCALVTRAFATA